MVRHTINFNSPWGLFEGIHKYRNVIGQCQSYLQYSESSRDQLRVYARSVLDILSGGDFYSLLNDLLKPEGVAKLHPCDKV